MCDVQQMPCMEVPIARDCGQSPCIECNAPAGYSAGVPMQCVVNGSEINTSNPNGGHNPCCCGRPECCAKAACCYVQPPREPSFKPTVAYSRPTVPVETQSVYKRSYYGVDACTAKMARGVPIKQRDNLTGSDAMMDTCTVQKLSYQPNCGAIPPAPIKPLQSRLLLGGPMQSVTTQKHDFVPKPICMRKPIVHGGHIQKTTAPLEKLTVNRLSYMPIDVSCFPAPKPIKHDAAYQRPEGPAESCTVYKLSYLPNCPRPKEDYPWAKKIRYTPPPYTDLGTIYKYSYLPNCNVSKILPLHPCSALKIVGDGVPEKDTIYKRSYYCPNGSRPEPIKPKDALEMPTGKMEQCTVYKLSYIPNCNLERTMPIKPASNTRPSNEPMQSVTTQKHDFVPKPICRAQPLKQRDNILRSTAAMESHTVNRLSYMPNPCYQPPKPIKPDNGYKQMTGPPESCTTYKLSYMPVCPPPKENLPWVPSNSYRRPNIPMETCTVQKLSYMPPGRFMDSCCSGCSCRPNTMNMEKTIACFPKAAIC